MIAGKVLQRSVEIRVRQVPHIEQQIEIARISKLVTEADDADLQRRRIRRRAEFLNDQSSESMNRMLRRIDDKVGGPAYLFHRFPLRTDRPQQTFPGIRRVWPASFGEP